MSYYGVRKCKTVKTEQGKFNVACEFYDSSITDWENKRIWEKTDRLFNRDFDTKEELEKAMFLDALDGNLHGVGGKYACASWGHRKFDLSHEDDARLEILDKRMRKINKALKDYRDYLESNKGMTWNEVLEEPRAKRMASIVDRLYIRHNELRGDLFYATWKKYLKENGKKVRSIVEVCYNGCNRYLSSIGTRNLGITPFKEYARVTTKTEKELKELLEYSEVNFVRLIPAV